MKTMYCFGRERKWAFIALMAILIPIGIAAGVFIFGWVVMLLWNALLPSILGVGTVTFWQALGILVLSKILFGGFGGGSSHSKSSKRTKSVRDKWAHLTPEERERMKAEYQSRWCGAEEAKEFKD